MKLIHCPLCGDVVRLIDTSWRKCECGQVGGQYNKDLMTATIGGQFARVLGIGNPFFNEYWPLLTPEAKEQVRKKHGYSGTDCWWGDYPGEQQLFHISDPNGPRLKVFVTPCAGSFTGKNTVRIVDKREYTIDGKKDVGFVVVPANPIPSFKLKRKEKK